VDKRYFGAGVLVASGVLALAVGQARAASPDPALVQPVARALGEPVRALEAASKRGEPDARYALAILKAHGLRGVLRDEAGARDLKAAAGLSEAVARQSDACVAAVADISPSAQAAACGEQGQAFRGLWIKALPWSAQGAPACEVDNRRCKVLADRVRRLNARDPAAEAAAAAARGDFRLGAANHIGPTPTGWSTPGVECRTWVRALIGKWHVNQDVIRQGDRVHSWAAQTFIAAYNRTMVLQPAFPYGDICAEEGPPPGATYDGPIRSATEAARSRDLAKLAALPVGADLNARDVFGRTALNWAMANGDEAMARALLERGADPNLEVEGRPSPLAEAFQRKLPALAALMIAKGARMTGSMGLCVFDLDFDPMDRRSNRACTWAGLLARERAYDLLDAEAAAGRLYPVDRGFDIMDELDIAFSLALEAGDREAVTRLAPLVAARPSNAASVIDRLRAAGLNDLMFAVAVGPGAEAARSPAEAALWRAAAAGRQDGTLTLLEDYGADLNLLPSKALVACADAARAGDEARLMGCVAAAEARRARIAQALLSVDVKSFRALTAQAADVRERRKPTLLSAAIAAGSASMVKPLLDRGAREMGSWNGARPASVYAGGRPAPAGWTRNAGYLPPDAGHADQPAVAAALRGDGETLRFLADAGVGDLRSALQALAKVGGSPPGLPSVYGDADIDTSTLPSGPGPEAMKAVALLAAQIARTDGPQSLEDLFRSAAYTGYDDVMAAAITAGFDPSKAKDPARIWHNWAGSGNPCKPSTGRLLTASGLPTVFPPTEFSAWPPLHSLAAGCMNPRSVPVLLEAGYDVNRLDGEGRTAVDQAIRYNRGHLVAALRAAGGKTAKELDAKAVARRDEEGAREIDLDLSQWVEPEG
jgi:ankyrin repeat protein